MLEVGVVARGGGECRIEPRRLREPVMTRETLVDALLARLAEDYRDACGQF